ncbi:unnamed protein product [Heligmosomoides polygyrus]|uniref:E3 SUMO-protein ligase NSE2 n=1 Tax=Heligmosomoides polygyrus TaxID=6339 RepID=A0A3P8A802_HELPZ|nr:unnamed protein product [Heligmosomoides polygyrus]
MIRSKDLRVMQSGLHDVLKMLEETPLFEQETDSYLKAIAEAKKFDGQLDRDEKVLEKLTEAIPEGEFTPLEDLMKMYKKRLVWDRDRLCRVARPPSSALAESEGPQEEVQENGDGGEEMRVLEVVKSHRDPLGGGLIKDPIRSKDCGHVYDRATLREYIESSKAMKKMFYQCPYSLCNNKKNMDMKDMIDCPEFLTT